MARCGCQAAASTTCEAIVLCVAANLGPGLFFNSSTGNIQLRISGDAGNVASYGTDQGIYVPGEDVGPGPGPGRRTIAGLPDQVISGSWGGCVAQAPNGSPQSIEMAVDQRIDMINNSSYTGVDLIAQWSTGSIASSVFSRTDNPHTGPTWRSMDSTGLLGLNMDAGTRVSPTSRNSNAPSDMLSPDGGWYGFWAHQFRPMTTIQALTQIAARSVVVLEMPRGQTLERSNIDLNASIDAIIAAAAHEWCMIDVAGYLGQGERPPIAQWADELTAAGIVPAFGAYDEAFLDEPFTPAEIAAAGYEWVRYSWRRLVEERGEAGAIQHVQELVAADLNVTMITNSRQHLTDQMFDLGVRAVEGHDPVYARGGRGQAGDLNYRTASIPALQFRTTGIGMSTSASDDTFNNYSRGFGRANITGRWFYAGFGWDNGTGRWRNNQLLGQVCPIPNTTNYQLGIRARWLGTRPVGNQPKIGIAFGFETDQDPSYPIGEASPGHSVGYAATVNVGTVNSDRIQIFRYDPVTTTLIQEDPDDFELPVNMWTEMILSVEGPTITFTVTNETGTETVSVEDSNHRGAYAYYFWDDQDNDTDPDAGFVHAYQNPDGQPMYVELL